MRSTAAIDAMSGLTSQPNLGSIVEALRYGPRDTGIDAGEPARRSPPTGSRCAATTPPSRATCAPAPPRCTCTACRAGSTPTCASRRARSGIDGRALAGSGAAYADVNEHVRRHRQGDADLQGGRRHGAAHGELAASRREQVLDPGTEVAFPESVVQLFRGELGQPHGGFPAALQKKVLKGAAPLTGRPGATLPPADLDGRARAHPAASCRGR